MLTPAMMTVLRESSDDWSRSHAHAGTVEALERRGLIEAEYRRRPGGVVLDLFVRRTDLGREIAGA